MFDNFMLFCICACGLATSIVVVFFFIRSRLNVFHPFVILFLVSVIDVYLPGIIWAIDKIPDQPSWVPPLVASDAATGALFYFVSYLAMLCGYAATKTSRKSVVASHEYIFNVKIFIAGLWLLLALCIAQLALSVFSYGSIPAWFYQKLMVRWDGGLDGEAPGFLEVLPIRIVFSMFVIVGFYYRHKLAKPLLLGYVFPFIGLLLAALTFFRGSILVFILGLLFVERLRTRSEEPSVSQSSASIFKGAIDKTLLKWAISAVCLFLVYGGAREQLSNESWGGDTGGEVKISPLARGDGLVGVSSIVKYFDTPQHVLLGKTYMDMMLLPVPRFIYTSKPTWYGIDDITRSMGWAESTQSAVTIPGEAFANFWIFAPLFMPILGFLFGAVDRFASSGSPIGLFLYPSVLLYLVINSNWMAFTGIANQFYPLALCAFSLNFVFKKIK